MSTSPSGGDQRLHTEQVLRRWGLTDAGALIAAGVVVPLASDDS
ncbi:MAG: hypothetical protein ACR2KG_13275 [Nocardioidaceae bacterium]